MVIGTDAATWLALREGRLSGLDAFAQRRLYARGDLDLALGFEGLFRLPSGRPPLLRIADVEIGRARDLDPDRGHGTRAGDLPARARLQQGLVLRDGLRAHPRAHRPRDRPAGVRLLEQARPRALQRRLVRRAPSRPTWTPSEIERAHLVGNSLGGRVALEVGLREPERVASLSLLAPALAFRRKREFAPLVWLLRPELAAIPHPMRADRCASTSGACSPGPSASTRPWPTSSPTSSAAPTGRAPARIAFFAAARNIYLDAPDGEHGFWTRLRELEPPALFVWGDHDRLVPPASRDTSPRRCPEAPQVVLPDCGHVPQVELPERTNRHARAS